MNVGWRIANYSNSIYQCVFDSRRCRLCSLKSGFSLSGRHGNSAEQLYLTYRWFKRTCKNVKRWGNFWKVESARLCHIMRIFSITYHSLILHLLLLNFIPSRNFESSLLCVYSPPLSSSYRLVWFKAYAFPDPRFQLFVYIEQEQLFCLHRWCPDVIQSSRVFVPCLRYGHV